MCSIYAPILKKGNAKECSTYRPIALISRQGKCCSRFSNRDFYHIWSEKSQIFQMDSKKEGSTRDCIENIFWLLESAKELQKNIGLCFIDTSEGFGHAHHENLWICRNIWMSWCVNYTLNIRAEYGETEWLLICKDVYSICMQKKVA